MHQSVNRLSESLRAQPLLIYAILDGFLSYTWLSDTRRPQKRRGEGFVVVVVVVFVVVVVDLYSTSSSFSASSCPSLPSVLPSPPLSSSSLSSSLPPPSLFYGHCYWRQCCRWIVCLFNLKNPPGKQNWGTNHGWKKLFFLDPPRRRRRYRHCRCLVAFDVITMNVVSVVVIVVSVHCGIFVIVVGARTANG